MDKIYEDLEFHIRISKVFDTYLNLKQANLVKNHNGLYTAGAINKFFLSQKTITKKLIKLLYDEKVNIDWVCTGRGNPLINQELVDNHQYDESIPVYKRLEEAFNIKGIGQSELTEKYSFLSKALISNYFNINTTITKDISKLCFYEDVNIDWVCTGRGEMFIDENKVIDKNSDFVDTLSNGQISSNIDEKTIELLKQLSQEQREYYFHKISADVYENKLKK